MSKRYPGGIIRKTPPTPSQTSAQGIWDMASVTQAVKENTWPIAGVPDPISRSLRFRSSASAYLNRTPASVGNRRTWTFSTWLKLGEIAASNGTIFAAGTASGETTRFYLRYTGSQFQTGYGSQNLDTTSAVYRDPSAWYHVVLAVDTTQSTAANRLKIYVNGVQQAVSTSVNYTQNVDTAVNNSVTHSIARDHIIPGGYFDGYLTETYLIDGQALTPSSFGSTNDQTGVWQPIAYTGTYGTNGFYLPFSNTASTTTLGYDFSGNSNNWTTNNISLTSGSTYDSMVDVPTQWIPYNTAGDTGALFRGNYAVMNPLDKGTSVTISQGNLSPSIGSATWQTARATIAFPTTGKWYVEATSNQGGGSDMVGIGTAQAGLNNYAGADAYGWSYNAGNGYKYNNGSGSAYGATYTTGDVIGVAFDADAGTLTFYKNNVSQGTAFSSLTGGPYYLMPSVNNNNWYINFGQRPFSYTPPAGFKTLCTTNLSTPTIGATASTQANDYFNAITYTGNGSTQTVTGLDFTPGMLWIKDRSAVTNHQVNDQVRGVGRELQPDATTAETNNNIVTAFNSNGFSLSSNGNVNANGEAYVAWTWKANGSGSTNTAGSITSTVSVDTTAGFSIVTWTGTGANATVGHGLGVAPSMVIVKSRTDSNTWWLVYHQNLTSAAYYLALQRTDGQASSATVWNNTAPTSTVFTVGTSNDVNGSTKNLVAYCFAQVAGYSAFGSYTGNGSSDGTFVYTGFRPRYVLVKITNTTGNWLVWDAARDTYNVVDNDLRPNLVNAESTETAMDFLSNGFKLRSTSGGWNGSGNTYIYMAFAESPFKFALAR